MKQSSMKINTKTERKATANAAVFYSTCFICGASGPTQMMPNLMLMMIAKMMNS